METPTVKHVNECFIRPKFEVEESKHRHYLTPWDVPLLSIRHMQLGFLFIKPSQDQNFSIHNLLKSLQDSLALTLVHFYPLAGQLVSQINKESHKCVVFIDCNTGPGAQFIYATLDMTVSDILSPSYVPPVVKSLFEHEEWTIVNYDGHSRPLLSIKVTELVDGIFIACSMNHAVADGVSYFHFWNVWSEIHRAKGRPIAISRPPVHQRWFPDGCGPEFVIPFTADHYNEFIHPYKPPAELRQRFFHFSSKSMIRLKMKANEDTNNSCSTKSTTKVSSYMALTALVWQSIVRANGLGLDEVIECKLAANNRSRLVPPLPQEYFGNSQQSIKTTITVGELLGNSLGWVASLLHQSVVTHDDKAVRSSYNQWVEAPLFIDYGKLDHLRTLKTASSPRFDMYGNEFEGLGRPIAARDGIGNKYVGKVIAYPGREGGGSVDLQICLLPDSMGALESDQEFMAVVEVCEAGSSYAKFAESKL